jgi:hypothetical protein
MNIEDILSGQAFGQKSLEDRAREVLRWNDAHLSGPELIDEVESALTDYTHSLIHTLIQALDL